MNNNIDPSGSVPADESDSSDELDAALSDRESLNDVALVTVRMATDGGARTDLSDAMKVFGISRDELEAEIDAGPHEI